MAGVIDAIRTNTAEIDQAKQQMTDIHSAVSEQLSTLSEATAKGTITGARGVPTTVDAEKQRMAADLAEQTANQQRANTVDFEQYSNELLGAIKEAGAQRDQKLKEIQDINTSSNPLEHILGVFTIPFKAVQAKDAANIAEAKVQELAQVNQLMQSSAKTTAEIQTRVTESTNASVAEALAHDQLAAAAKARIFALQTGANQVKDILSMSEQQLRNKIKQFDIGEAMDMRAMRKAQMEQMMDIRKEAADSKQAAKLSIDSINYALISNGKDPIPEEQVPLIAQQLNKPGEFGEMLRALFTQGTIARLSDGQFTQGDTPTEAAEFRNKIGYIPTSETERDTLAVVEGTMQSAPAVREAKNNTERFQAANQAVKTKLSQDESNINTSPGSLAKPISWATMAASDAFRDTKLFKEVISPQITDNISTNAIEPTDLFKRLAIAVKHKQATVDEAVNYYNTFANQSVLMNNQVSGLHKLTGLEQTKFIVHLPQPRQFSNLFTFKAGETEGNILPQLTSGINGIKRFMGNINEPVDALNQTRLYEAFTSYLAGELREPKK